MGGELAINVKEIVIDEPLSIYDTSDLRIVDEDNNRLYICGKNNDWPFLMIDALKPIKKRAQTIVDKAIKAKETSDIEAVVLGKREKRDMDVLFGGYDKCNRIVGIPVIKSEENTCLKFLVEHKK